MGDIARVGENCWQRPHANRASVLIDGEAYFGALATAIGRAERSILILGWDFHEGTRLVQGKATPRSTVLELLSARLRTRRQLHVWILDWSFSVVFATERELFPSLRRPWGAPRRIDFRYDDSHPSGASHHQKVIVVDDALAFCGGLDVTARRWDTRAHLPEDPRRIDPWGSPYGPFHDVQMVVDGEAAAALGTLARRRWQRATGEQLRAVAPSDRGDPWPPDLPADFQDVDVAIARTEPAFEGEPEVREVERLYLDAIAAARRLIFFEDQYLSSHAIHEAIAARLAEPGGPEVVLIGPSQSSGFLEDAAMGAMRARALLRLTDACAEPHRIAAFSPVVGADATPVMVHSKVMVVDDCILRVGSSNLCNRSMSLDTECDLQIEAGGDRRVAAQIARVRNDLLAEHLGESPEKVAAVVADSPSLVCAIERLGRPERRLVRLEPSSPGMLASLLEAAAPFDAEQPVEPERLLVRLGVDETAARAGRALVGAALLVAALLVAWRWTSFDEALASSTLARSAMDPVAVVPSGPFTAALVLGVASLLMIPLTLLVTASGLVFGPWTGAAVALGGAFIGAMAGYGIGARLPRGTVRRLAGRRLNVLRRHFARRTMRAIALVRLVPYAPFGLVNLVAGSSDVGLGRFAIGTLLGMAPGTLALCYVADRLAAGRSWETLVIVAGTLVATIAMVRGLRAER